jgi:hypothetical protein
LIGEVTGAGLGIRVRDVLRQHHRQLLFRHRHVAALAAQDHRDRATPVALAAHAPVAQAEVDPALAALLLRKTIGKRVERLLEIHAVEFAGVHQPAALGVGALFGDGALEFLDHLHRGARYRTHQARDLRPVRCPSQCRDG